MAGIEKITAEIISEANARADEILKSAQDNAKSIISEAEAKAEIEEKDILSKAEAKANSIMTSAESAGLLDKKNKILSAKQELINLSFDKAVNKLQNLDKDEYFDVLKRLMVYYAVKGEGEIILSSKDKENLPSDFLNDVNGKLDDKKSLKISDKTDDKINGGFDIKYDEIEINCNFDKIILSERERLIDSVNQALFN